MTSKRDFVGRNAAADLKTAVELEHDDGAVRAARKVDQRALEVSVGVATDVVDLEYFTEGSAPASKKYDGTINACLVEPAGRELAPAAP